MSQEIADQLLEFIRTRFRVAADDDVFGVDVHLFEEGYVDSTGVIELLAHIEQSFVVTLPDDVLFSEEFVTVRGMAELVARARAEAHQILATEALRGALASIDRTMPAPAVSTDASVVATGAVTRAAAVAAGKSVV